MRAARPDRNGFPPRAISGRPERSGTSKAVLRDRAPCGLLRSGAIKGRQLLLELGELGQVVVDDVRLIRVKREIVLVIVLGRIELVERHYLRDDRLAEHLRGVELRDVVLRDL